MITMIKRGSIIFHESGLVILRNFEFDLGGAQPSDETSKIVLMLAINSFDSEFSEVADICNATAEIMQAAEECSNIPASKLN